MIDIPNIEVCVNAHHDSSDGSAAFEDEDPSSVEEEEYAEAELHGISEGSDVVNVIVQFFPESFSSSVEEEQSVNTEWNGNFNDDFDAKSRNG